MNIIEFIYNNQWMGAILESSLVLFLMLIAWNYYNKKIFFRNIPLLYGVIIIFLVFACYGGDWYHYYEIVTMMKYSTHDYMSSITSTHMETPYWILASVLKYNYLLFRIVIWGVSVLFLYSSSRLLGYSRDAFLFSFISVVLVSISISRVVLSQSIAFLGYAFILRQFDKRRFKPLQFTIGLFLIIFSFYFHKSSPIFIAAILASLIPLNKNSIRFLLAGYPVVLAIVYFYVIPYVLNTDAADSEYININSAQNYLGGNSSLFTFSFTGLLVLVIYWFFWKSFTFASDCLKNYHELQRSTRSICSLIIILLYVATAFLWFSATMFNRFAAFCFIPVGFLIAALLTSNNDSKRLKNLATVASAYAVFCVLLNSLGRILFH